MSSLQTLIVLDNCQHLPDTCASLAEALLAAARVRALTLAEILDGLRDSFLPFC